MHFAFLLPLLIGLATAKVVELNDGDFNFEIAKTEVAIVLFYAPWCYHCVNLKEEFKIAAGNLSKPHPNIKFIQVDCTDRGKNTCDKFQVKGYPTVKIFIQGEYREDYDGPRKADALEKYMSAQVGPSTRELYTVKELEFYLAEEYEPCMVGYFLEETVLKTAYLDAADQLRGKFRCAHVGYPELLEELSLSDDLILYREPYLSNKFENRSVRYGGQPHATEILKFLNENRHGLVGVRTLDNMDQFQPPMIVAYYKVDFKSNPKSTHYWRNRILSVAVNFPTVTFAISPQEDFPFDLQDIGLDPDNLVLSAPLIVARDEDHRYLMKGNFSTTGLFVFAEDFVESRLQPFVKSEPAANNSGSTVVKVVATTFHQLVVDTENDTLLYLYDPKSTKCKEFNKTYVQLAEKLRNEPVVLAVMDATANDVPPSCSHDSLPAIFWFRAHAKHEPLLYEGDRGLKEMLKFVAREATEELRNYNRNGNERKKKRRVKTEL